MATVAYLVQDRFEAAGNDDLFPEVVAVDRCTAWWHSHGGPDGFRSRYGPALATFEAAANWASVIRPESVVLQLVDGQEISVDGSQLPLSAPTWPPSTVQVETLRPLERWRCTFDIRLAPGDFELAADGFEERLADVLGEPAARVTVAPSRIATEFVVLAANQDLAAHLARHIGLRAASDFPEGLRETDNVEIRLTGGPQ